MGHTVSRRPPTRFAMTTISTPLAPAQVLARWDALIRTSAKTRRFAGDVSGATIRLMYTPSVGRSALRPQLVGTVASASAGSDITVAFQFSPAVQPFLKGGFVLGALWTLVATAMVGLQPHPGILALLPLAGLTVLGLGALIVRFAKVYYRDDEALLVRTISEALGG